MNDIKDKAPIIEIKDISKKFGDNKVLNNFHLALYPGDHLVIMGKSGSGKSVMIRCLVGLMLPDSGSIEIQEKDITQLTQKELNDLRTKLGFLFQVYRLPNQVSAVTVAEAIEGAILNPFNSDELAVARDRYLSGKTPKLYAERLLGVLENLVRERP